MSDVSAVTHLLATVNEGFTTTVGAAGVTSGGATVPLASVGSLVNGSTFVGIVEPGATNQQVFTGIVDTAGSQITGVKWTRGANVSHAAGATIVDYETGTIINMLTKWAKVQHNDDGTHSNITAVSSTLSGALSAASAAITGNETVGGNLTVTGTSRNVPVSITTASTITPSAQIYNVTALGSAATIALPTIGSNDGQAGIIRILDNGTARGLTWASGWVDVTGIGLPSTTVLSKLLTIGYMYNANTSKWEVQGINQQ